MSNDTEVKCWCQHCERALAPEHTGECPYCGQIGKNCAASASVSFGLKVIASATHARTVIQWQNKEVKAILIAILVDVLVALVSVLLGYFISGWIGALIGFAISLLFIISIHLIVNRKIKTLVHEIRHYQ